MTRAGPSADAMVDVGVIADNAQSSDESESPDSTGCSGSRQWKRRKASTAESIQPQKCDGGKRSAILRRTLREKTKRPAGFELGPQGGRGLAPGLNFEWLQEFKGESGFCRQSDFAVPCEAGTARTRGSTD
jgi:hypothetical protein